MRCCSGVRSNGQISGITLERKHTLTLITGYDVKARHAVNKCWLELEKMAETPEFALLRKTRTKTIGKQVTQDVFTLEVLQDSGLVLPVWAGVTKEQVYKYSPYLLNVKGVDWNALGEEEVCRLIYLETMGTMLLNILFEWTR